MRHHWSCVPFGLVAMVVCWTTIATGADTGVWLSASGPAPQTAQRQTRGTFTLSTTRLVLSDKVRSMLLSVRNDSNAPLSLGVEVFQWDQEDNAGELVLQPTSDLVFFPRALTLAPGEARNIRVGTTGAAGATEQAYRLVLEEVARARAPGESAGVGFRLKQSLPVFVMPSRLRPQVRLESVTMSGGKVYVSVANTGNVHGMATAVTVRGLSADGGTQVFEATRSGWYVLAGRAQQYHVDLPAADCAKASSLAVDVRFSETTLSRGVALPPAACSPDSTGKR